MFHLLLGCHTGGPGHRQNKFWSFGTREIWSFHGGYQCAQLTNRHIRWKLLLQLIFYCVPTSESLYGRFILLCVSVGNFTDQSHITFWEERHRIPWLRPENTKPFIESKSIKRKKRSFPTWRHKNSPNVKGDNLSSFLLYISGAIHFRAPGDLLVPYWAKEIKGASLFCVKLKSFRQLIILLNNSHLFNHSQLDSTIFTVDVSEQFGSVCFWR